MPGTALWLILQSMEGQSNCKSFSLKSAVLEVPGSAAHVSHLEVFQLRDDFAYSEDSQPLLNQSVP